MENNSKIIDTIAKQIEIIKIKILIFVAGFGGAWVFITANYSKIDFLVIISIAFLMLFGVGIATNLTRLSGLYKELEKIKDSNGSN
ncbi:hypothetical protein [Campylobacter sp. CCUG 57310]|uniref:hypothetical protein n=1 Tax=Campylobacter TaxID=194 RepID=UPI0015658A54|nr:hypothetical protein [Campylobacter sp. CCUG 57310]QKF93244.1 hypothetical protein CORI_b009 [Campylobacter sp. CCUG 57310]